MKPKIRFKGFEGEWKKTLVSDKCKIATGKSNTQDQVEDGLYPFYIRSEKVVRSNKYLYDCEAVLTIGDGNIGRVFHYVNGKFDLHQRCYKMTDFRGVNAKYFFYFFSTFFYDRAIKMSAKATVDSVRMEMIADMPLRYPNSKIEQQAIASYFTSLDSQISASTSRLASLKQMKAASLQAMFPQEWETVPKVRFKGFEGEWKKVKFSNIAIILRGLTYSPEDIVKEGVRVLRSSNIDDDTFVLTDSDVYVSNKCVNIDAIQKGDILITAANGSPRLVGKHTLVKEYDDKMQVAGGFMLRVISNESNFLNASMSSDWYKRFLKTGVAGGNGAIGNLNKNDLEETVLLIPETKKERDAIANYFTTLDRQITLQTQRLEKLKQIKSACLTKCSSNNPERIPNESRRNKK